MNEDKPKASRGRPPPDDEIQLRQLPRELHPGRHEAVKAKGVQYGRLQSHAGRAGVLRFRGHARPGGLQGRRRRDRHQPLERRVNVRRGQGLYEGSV